MWVWELNPNTPCDHFGLVYLDAGRSPVNLTVLPKTALLGSGLPPGFIVKPRSDGTIAVVTQGII